MSTPLRSPRPPALACAAGLVSLGGTACVTAVGGQYGEGEGPGVGWQFAECGALLLLLALAARAAHGRAQLWALAPAAIAVPTLLLRFDRGPVSAAVAFLGVATWALLALLVAAAGRYLGWLDARRVRAVAAARRAQSLQLARDLNDFVAHDVSEMLAQAQAGQIVAAHDPERAADLFRGIELAGQRALAAMDRTVHMLRDGDPTGGESAEPHTRLPTTADLPELAARFSAVGGAHAHLDLDPAAARVEDRALATTVYRIVVEALTNVRRHAPTASRVDITVRRLPGAHGDTLRVTVADDGRGTSAVAAGLRRRRGGRGLPGLTERVAALGGSLTAGPRSRDGNGDGDGDGWRLSAVLPLDPVPRAAVSAPAAPAPAGPRE
ncbi:ATP-binding protein [Streptomyces sp. B6B3]|uniref:sensor histidine kinase n=1 Tax=Streptomyces sp. B6B3 TaxID=3153570 RepID=UPI00325C4D55